MNHEKFVELLNELDGNSLDTLATKNGRYASNEDSLHNFNAGASVMGGTPAQACWGYLTKHLVSLRDRVINNDFSDREDLLEKCQDSINYIRFLWCIANETEPVNTAREFDISGPELICLSHIPFKSYEDAKDTLNDIFNILKKNKSVSVADIADLAMVFSVDVTTDFEDAVHGWTTINNYAITRSGANYYLNLPLVELLKDI